MSLDALRWALKSAPQKSSQKLILISLADRASEELEAWPSTERLELDTLLDLKTVKKSLSELEQQGFIADTGKRKGRTGRVKVWKLVDVNLREHETSWKKEQIEDRKKAKDDENKPAQKRNDSKNGSIKSDHKRVDIESNQPKNGTMKQPNNGTIESTQKRDAEPPILLTTQDNHPVTKQKICATSSDEPVTRLTDQENVPGVISNEPEVYITAKNRKLSGENLANFMEFWETFNYKKGKAPAADAWLKIHWAKKTDHAAAELNRELLVMILTGAAIERAQRELKIEAGQTPCYAEKWLSSKRWEDEDPDLVAQRLALREEVNQVPASNSKQARERVRAVLRDVMATNW